MEWLVSDQHGLFAMGTASGMRTRKYHGFLCGIAGRAESNFLAHLDLECNGTGLWTHAYNSPSQTVLHPSGAEHIHDFKANPWPTWQWRLPDGELTGQLIALQQGGFSFTLGWRGHQEQRVAELVIRPLWAMRALHALGAAATEARFEGQTIHFLSRSREAQTRETWIAVSRPFEWLEHETWYRNFLYRVDAERGYDANEDLYCAGEFKLSLAHAQSVTLQLSRVPIRGFSPWPEPRATLESEAHALEDFMLRSPAGVVAGFPWFGEWGRDTFIALPGLVAGSAAHDSSVVSWAVQVLDRWSAWIERDGMIPNLIATDGPQWESADGTLWWTHALASLWALGLARPELGLVDTLVTRFAQPLTHALQSILSNRHKHLEVGTDGLLEVTSPHSTWMDAQVDGRAATPRLGALPEINALWIQARALRDLWTGTITDTVLRDARRLQELALEPQRPNFVFVHSLPLAPSALAPAAGAIARDLESLMRWFATPVGLRTLSPQSPNYQPSYSGGPCERDQCYHQGPAWGWLQGHYEMALTRHAQPIERVARSESLSSIPNHYAELFDAEAPFAWRGAPAQAWSLACRAEARARRDSKIDELLQKLIKDHYT